MGEHEPSPQTVTDPTPDDIMYSMYSDVLGYTVKPGWRFTFDEMVLIRNEIIPRVGTFLQAQERVRNHTSDVTDLNICEEDKAVQALVAAFTGEPISQFGA